MKLSVYHDRNRNTIRRVNGVNVQVPAGMFSDVGGNNPCQVGQSGYNRHVSRKL